MTNQIMLYVPWRTRHKVPSFKLWHMSLMITSHVSSHLPKTHITRDPSQSYRGTYTHIQKSRNSVGIKFQSLQELQPSNLNNIRREIIQVIFINLKVHWNQVQKCSETLKDCKLVKIYGFKPPKYRRTSTTIFEDKEHTKKIWRTYKEHEEWRIPNKHIVRDSS